jgi:hypothetical protein
MPSSFAKSKHFFVGRPSTRAGRPARFSALNVKPDETVAFNITATK